MLLPLVVHPNMTMSVFPEVKPLNIALLQHVSLSDDPTLVAELSLRLTNVETSLYLESTIAGLSKELMTYHTHQEELDHNNLLVHKQQLFFQNLFLHDTERKNIAS